jgi:transposase
MPDLIKEVAGTFDIQANRPIKLWSEDEARFGRMNNPKRCWAPAKVRPIVHLQRIREYVYVFAATCSWTGETYSLILPLCNTEAMQIFLKKFSEEYCDYNNIVIVDQAAWHMTKKLSQFDNVRFIYLPAGSPELNPTEHLWEHVREKYLGNCVYDSLDEFEDIMVDILRKLPHEQETIKNLTGFHWMNIS